ncbi:YgaP-like transmembrane domain [Rickettsiella endosymbiont of Dermanyssus gallinae]|uniref:YgaP-like transmembrane domain n=1 Tax=Rickettsiella endosymbiont of Dermanyssus gallinae TaxID=2856608 RepID=UPI001C533AA6|nr:YgaP-like transmembrane domain [Rickettsiella endosymbiont of Dermanyssus gallinae]
MLNVASNIQGNERISRLVIGVVLLIGVLLGLGKLFAFLVGVILIVEGVIGWCGIPILAEKFKLNEIFRKRD